MVSIINECRYAECHYSECHYAECHYAECHYAVCPYAEYHYAECRSVQKTTPQNCLKSAASLWVVMWLAISLVALDRPRTLTGPNIH
jgi:hypothetical protein